MADRAAGRFDRLTAGSSALRQFDRLTTGKQDRPFDFAQDKQAHCRQFDPLDFASAYVKTSAFAEAMADRAAGRFGPSTSSGQALRQAQDKQAHCRQAGQALRQAIMVPQKS